MISIVICSKQPRLEPALVENIEATVGCEHETVFIDNSRSTYSLFEAYNQGVDKAQGDILCFMHDDIRLLTPGWGPRVLQHMADGVGLIGVIGNHVVPDCPASWWTTSLREGHVVGQVECGGRDMEKGYAEVALIDGLWFCMPRQLFVQVRFDSRTFKGFHCYDSDICMQVLTRGYSARVVFDIDIEHYSVGPLDQTFFDARRQWYEKWQSHLPLCRGVDLSAKELDLLTGMSLLSNELLEEKTMAEQEVRQLRSSHAYRIGKQLLNPLKWLRR